MGSTICRLAHGSEWSLLDPERGLAWLDQFQTSLKMGLLGPLSPTGGNLDTESQLLANPHFEYDFQLEVDAAVAIAIGYFGVGFAIRDASGEIRVAVCIPIMEPVPLLAVELLTLQHGMLFYVDTGYNRVRVLSDSLLAIQAVTGQQQNNAHEGIDFSHMELSMRESMYLVVLIN